MKSVNIFAMSMLLSLFWASLAFAKARTLKDLLEASNFCSVDFKETEDNLKESFKKPNEDDEDSDRGSSDGS